MIFRISFPLAFIHASSQWQHSTHFMLSLPFNSRIHVILYEFRSKCFLSKHYTCAAVWDTCLLCRFMNRCLSAFALHSPKYPVYFPQLLLAAYCNLFSSKADNSPAHSTVMYYISANLFRLLLHCFCISVCTKKLPFHQKNTQASSKTSIFALILPCIWIFFNSKKQRNYICSGNDG